MTEVNAQFPAPFQALFEPKRYKVLWGGRGAGRSWGVARKFVMDAAKYRFRVLCARELQNSMAESVHRVLADQIDMLGMNYLYDVQRDKIIGRGEALGAQFNFEGIKNNVTKIKSYEGLDRCWVEEANKVSKYSWGVLTPTIRKPGSEIWITFNPELDTDYTYDRFVKNADDSMIVVKMTWRDNPWFPDVLREDMERDKKRDYDYYLNVWEGHCVQIVEGAVFGKELRRAQEEGRICKVDWERGWPVNAFFDLGRRDATAIWFGQRVSMQYRILAYFSDVQEEIGYYIKELQRREYIYDTIYLPHDAKAKHLGSKLTIEEQVRQAGFKVSIVPKLSVTDGINAARTIFPQCWFDESRCDEGLQELRHYKYRVGVDGKFSNEPEHSDGGDAFRYLAVAMRGKREPSGVVEKLMRLTADRIKGRENVMVERGRVGSGQSWMR